MASAKRTLAKASIQSTIEPISMARAVDPASGVVTLRIFDGSRQPIEAGIRVLVTVIDGAQNQLFRDFIAGPAVSLKLPIHNNFADDYSIVASADGYEQAGFQPVQVGPDAQILDLMLLRRKGEFNFAHAMWTDLEVQSPQVSRIFAASGPSNPSVVYGQLTEEHPDWLACLLNITTAMEQIQLPHGTPLDYFKTFDLATLAPDRFFGYADATLVEEVKSAAQQGEFDTEPSIDLTLHGDATSSFKQKQFGEANVQLTFHEKEKRTIDGVACVYVEPDIDYYKDLGAHLLLEVIPNELTGSVSNPRVVYVLRWIAGQHAGVPNFNPLYTIE